MKSAIVVPTQRRRTPVVSPRSATSPGIAASSAVRSTPVKCTASSFPLKPKLVGGGSWAYSAAQSCRQCSKPKFSVSPTSAAFSGARAFTSRRVARRRKSFASAYSGIACVPCTRLAGEVPVTSLAERGWIRMRMPCWMM